MRCLRIGRSRRGLLGTNEKRTFWNVNTPGHTVVKGKEKEPQVGGVSVGKEG